MINSEPEIRRKFIVTKDNGEVWDLLYTSRGTRWEWRGDGDAEAAQTGAKGARNSGSSAAVGLLQAASGPIGAVAALVESVTGVLSWWESRQYRLMDQARFEEQRRIPWTADMMARWVKTHEDGQHLDLRITSFLAREATATMNALIADKTMAIPQALLYDLELIRETLSNSRRLYADQFDLLALGTQSDVSDALHQALPNTRINLPFIESLVEDPTIEWSRRVREKASKAFDEELRETTRHQEVFMNTLLKSTEIDRTAVDQLDQGLLDKVRRRVSLVPSLPGIVSEQLRGDATARRDDFRELALFAAESSRVNALHTAWGIVDTAVRAQVGSSILVSELAGSTRLSFPSSVRSHEVHSRRAIES